MPRVRSRPPSRPATRGWWLALLAVASLLLAPTMVSPAHASGRLHAAGCGMDAPAAQASHTPSRRTVCAAACALCAQLAPAQVATAAAAPPARFAAAVTYPSRELRLAGVEPERGTPPPR